MRTIRLEYAASQIELVVSSPIGVEPIDDYRDVRFEIPGGGRRRAVFMLLPDRNSDDPFATAPADAWDVPVRWDDKTMLFIPALDDAAIVAAVLYILANGMEDAAFEDETDIGIDG